MVGKWTQERDDARHYFCMAYFAQECCSAASIRSLARCLIKELHAYIFIDSTARYSACACMHSISYALWGCAGSWHDEGPAVLY